MKTLTIASPEAVDAAVADVVRKRIEHTELTAGKDGDVALIEQAFQKKIAPVLEDIGRLETAIQDYCLAHRAELFPDKKSRETTLAEFGFEITPPRVETSSKKVRWKDVLARLLRLAWGKAYIREPEAQVDKQALLADREKLSPEQCMAAGIQFCQDEQFFIRPKPETAKLQEGA